MNTITGIIQEISSHQDLTSTKVKVGSSDFEVLTIQSESAFPNQRIGDTVDLLFKETEVILGKGAQLNSLPNQVEGKVQSIELGRILSKVVLQSDIGIITAIVPSSSLQRLELKTGDLVIAMVKTNEMMISL